MSPIHDTTFAGSKGGSGTSIVAATAALIHARNSRADGDAPVLLVDAAEHPDPAAILGMASTPTTRGPVTAAPGLLLMTFPIGPEHVTVIAQREGASIVIIDGGLIDRRAPEWDEFSARSVLVTRGDYLALRRAISIGTEGFDGFLLVEEQGRSLGRTEVADVLDLPCLSGVPVRPAIARAVDAGVLAARLPDPLRRAVSRLYGVPATD